MTQHIFQVRSGDELKASCHSTDREEAKRTALELAAEIGGNCVVQEKQEASAWTDWLWEQDCPYSR